MLVSFSVSNFRSFGEEVTLSMVASNRYSDHSTHVMSLPGGDRSVVRTAVIYGANAAGKSNLVKAMEYAQKWILGAAGRLSAVDAHAFQPNARAKPSSFEFRFVANGRIFAYGFDVTRHSIQGEWLALVGAEDDEVIFERNADGHTKVDEAILKKRFPNDTKIINLLTSLSKNDLNDSQLFIESVREVRPASQGETMAEVVRWLTRTLVVIPMEQAHEHVLRRLARDPEYLGFAEALLGNVGTGIHRLQIEERERRIHEGMDATFDDIARHVSENPDTDAVMSRNPRAPDRYVARYLMASHSSDGMEYRLPMSEESDGTRRLLALAPLLKAGAKEPRVFVVDELDRSLHPLLCWEFLRLFADTMPGAQRQLVVTTHEAHLLNQELLRRDEYWFMEKDETQQSRLYPLSEYRDVRKDLQLERGYLSGRFGAVPVIGRTDDLEALLADPGKEPLADAPQATPTDRESGVVRDASLVVIASEDTYAVQHYFAKFHARRVQFKVLPTAGGRSSPEAALERLDSYRREYDISEGDELWVCIDLDHWAEAAHIANLRRVLKEAEDKGYRIALSNPCFDFWILLHFEDPPSDGIRRCGDVADRLRQILGGFTKRSIHHLRLTPQQVEQAIERARQLPVVDSLTPGGPTTQMHRVLESLLTREAIRLREPR